jgi:hypothetical protein
VDPREAEDSKGIAANFKLVHRAAKALGSVPEMLSSRDFSEHGPDERAVILYVAFLCSRLLECSRDDRAAHIIQRAWRQYLGKTAGKTPSTKVQAFTAWCDRERLRQGPCSSCGGCDSAMAVPATKHCLT